VPPFPGLSLQSIFANGPDWQLGVVMNRTSFLHLIAGILGTLLCLTFGGVKTKAQETKVAGQYACVEVHVAGKIANCTAAPLHLTTDGKFELEGREGEYLVNGSWVVLNGTLLKSRAKIEAGHRIVFRFFNKQGLCEIIFERRFAELGKTNLG
jgi:hypothetical protein